MPRAHAQGINAAFGTLILLHLLAQVVLAVFATLSLAGVDTMAPARGWRMYTGIQTALSLAMLGSVLFKFTMWSRVNTAVPVYLWASTQHVVAMTLATFIVMGAVEKGHSSGLIPEGGVWFDGEDVSVWSAASVASLWAAAMVLIVFASVSTVRHAVVTLPAMLKASARGSSRAAHTKGAWATGAGTARDGNSSDDGDAYDPNPRHAARAVMAPGWRSKGPYE